jgi:transcriptional regulator with XRE-family HTH domain
MDLRDRIREKIEESGLTERSASLAAGLSDSMLNKFLSGQTKSITIDNLEKIAAALETTVRYLLYGEEGDNVVSIYSRIPEERRKHALEVFETFAAGGGDKRA